MKNGIVLSEEREDDFLAEKPYLEHPSPTEWNYCLGSTLEEAGDICRAIIEARTR